MHQHALPAPRRARHARRRPDSRSAAGSASRSRRPARLFQYDQTYSESDEHAGVAVERQAGEEFPDALPAGGEIEQRLIGRLRDRGLRQADLQHDQERHEEEQGEPQLRREDREPRQPVAFVFDASYSTSTTPASAAQDSHTRSFAWIARAAAFITAAFIIEPAVEPHLVDRHRAEIADLGDDARRRILRRSVARRVVRSRSSPAAARPRPASPGATTALAATRSRRPLAFEHDERADRPPSPAPRSD